ncbi:MAG: radical SAM protein [Spirochaetes bacterium]|nr:radical SAM protein [Spirochaetota bacterium]
MTRLLLINPPYPFEECPAPPFGLMSLAAYLIREGFDVRIEDYIVEPYSAERVRQVLSEFRPHIAGSTAVTMNVKKALAILEDFRAVNPELVTLIGGPHATFDAEGMLSHSHIDYVIRGEGEITTAELLTAIESGRSAESIKGISYRKNGRVIHNDNRPFIENINTLPYPARDLVKISKYRALNFPVNMMTSRGCPHSCIFCVGHRMVGNRVRYFDVNRVVDEFEMLSRLGFNQINIVDDLFTSHKKRCMEICDGIIARGINHTWSAFARVDTVHEDLLEKMSDAGCRNLCFGIESGNQEILDRIKKRTTLDTCRSAAALCRKSGIEPMASYILGLPGETEETVRKTFAFAEEMGIPYAFHILAPFPGTEVRIKSAEYGISILTDDWDMYDANRSVCGTGGISPEKVNSIADEFYLKINNSIETLRVKNKNSEPLNEMQKEIVTGFESFNFSRRLITEKLVEKFSGDSSSPEIDFALYIARATGMDKSTTINEVSRLLRLQCIVQNDLNGLYTYSWK